MKLSRRQFFKLGGMASGLLAAGTLPAPVAATSQSSPKVKWTKETATICPYCAVGCGMIVGTTNTPEGTGGKVVNIEGDPDHPINQGALCSKGSTLKQLVNSDRRITKPMYRAPGASEWQAVEWDWALAEVASRIKQTRDANWIETDTEGRVVRRTEAIASVGSAALDNEECILLVKALRSMGLVYIEHQARI
jgi:formate dehydrogenase major subunit